MRVVVTGNQGYIGTVLSPILHSKGYEVWGIDSGLFDNYFFGDIQPTKTGIQKQITKDIRDIEIEDIKDAYAIIHLAALSNDALGLINPEHTISINADSSIRLAHLAINAGIPRYIFSSSCSIYGNSETENITENTNPNPITAYAKSKLITEMEVAKLDSDKFHPVFLRNATAYGLSPKMRFDLVVNNLLGWGYTTGSIRLFSNGEAWRPLIHVEDICYAILAALTSPVDTIKNQSINIGTNSENYKIIEIARQIKYHLPDTNLEIPQEATQDQRSYKVSFDKAKILLPNFHSRWTINDGIKQLLDAFELLGLDYNIFQDMKYHRLDYLKYLLDSKIIKDDFRV